VRLSAWGSQARTSGARRARPGVVSDATVERLDELGVGLMAQPASHLERFLPGRVWAADNGCFAEAWDADEWRWWLQRQPREGCLFAVVPDVVANAEATAERYERWAPLVRFFGFPTAYVAQDGLTELPEVEFDVLFLGGTTEFKLGEHAAHLTECARAKGIPVHMGRVNSLKRLRYAHQIGCTSADGTFLKFGPEINLPKMKHWLGRIRQEPTLAESL
jgi:hypothetical protein